MVGTCKKMKKFLSEQVCADQTDAFSLDATAPFDAAANVVISEIDTRCSMDYVVIPCEFTIFN